MADYYRPVLHGKRVTVVLPAYNAESTLKRTVDEAMKACHRNRRAQDSPRDRSR